MINKPDRFETTLMEFEHGVTRSAVHIVGMMHFAQEDYYEQIQTELNQRHDANHLVHYEFIQESGEKTDWLTARKISILKKSKGQVERAFGGLGLIPQKDGVELRPEWENHDLSLESYVSQLPTGNIVKRVAGAVLFGKIFASLPAETRAEVFAEVFEKVEDRIINTRSVRLIDERETRAVREVAGIEEDKITLEARNDIALRALDHVLKLNRDQDITLMWGEAHLFGLREGLHRRGFYQTDQQRLTAVNYADMHEAAKYTQIITDYRSTQK